MANIKSALKRIRQTKTRTARNRAAISRMKTLRKKVADAVEKADKEAASVAYNEFSSAVDKAAKTGKIPANRASNYKSKAAKAIAKIA
jgi:small subunit ribosomal protein S20